MPVLKAFFAGEINTRSFVTVACKIGFTLEHTVRDQSPFRPPCQRQSSLGSGAKDSLARDTQNFFV